MMTKDVLEDMERLMRLVDEVFGDNDKKYKLTAFIAAAFFIKACSRSDSRDEAYSSSIRTICDICSLELDTVDSMRVLDTISKIFGLNMDFKTYE